MRNRDYQFTWYEQDLEKNGMDPPPGKRIWYGDLPAYLDERTMKLDFNIALSREYNETELVTNGVCKAVWSVCNNCEGRGTSTAWMEPEGGGFTSSEWAEMCYDDPDFAEDYFGGKYDRDCPDCNGRRVTISIDPDCKDEVLLQALRDKQDGINQCRVESEYERRMGA